jgi:hypothetical protein
VIRGFRCTIAAGISPMAQAEALVIPQKSAFAHHFWRAWARRFLALRLFMGSSRLVDPPNDPLHRSRRRSDFLLSLLVDRAFVNHDVPGLVDEARSWAIGVCCGFPAKG